MTAQSFARCSLGLVLACGALLLPATGSFSPDARQQKQTLAPAGPFHVEGNQLVDSRGRAFLIRGTDVPEFRRDTVAHETRNGSDYGPYTGTTLSAIRLRFNMNAVRVPVSATVRAADMNELARVIHRINEFEMAVILADANPQVAAHFKSEPNVIFEAASAAELQAIRAAGVQQPVLTAASVATSDANIVRGLAPNFEEWRTGRMVTPDRPVLARWDLDLDRVAECSNVPTDPAAAERIVKRYLEDLDRHQISWVVSSFTPGKLIRDLAQHDATTLDNGWTCGQRAWPPAGLGRIVQAHMRATEPMGLFVVGTGGGIEVAPGAAAMAYGPSMARYDATVNTRPLPLKLAGISVDLTDAAGKLWHAEVLSANEGWGQVNYIIPDGAAEGPARMTLIRDDGTRVSGPLTIARTAPGFWTDISCRGPATGFAFYTTPSETTQSKLSACRNGRCESVEVRMDSKAKVRLRLDASGMRFARAGEIEVAIGGVVVPVVSAEASDAPGKDYLTVEIPRSLRGMGDADLVTKVNGRVANVVRVRIGG